MPLRTLSDVADNGGIPPARRDLVDAPFERAAETLLVRVQPKGDQCSL
jgi:hypothetical protein